MNRKDLNIIGVGSLGSFTALLTAKMAITLGFRVKFYDFDKVEAHNPRNQLYRTTDVGKFKVAALKEILEPLVENTIEAYREKVSRNSNLSGIVVVLVDDMDVRGEIFEACKFRADIPYYIEARTAGDRACVYAFDPRDPDCVARYQKTLFPQIEGIPQPCANDRTIPTLFAVGSVIEDRLEKYAKKTDGGKESKMPLSRRGLIELVSAVLAKILVRFKTSRVFTGDFVESIINLEDLPTVMSKRLET